MALDMTNLTRVSSGPIRLWTYKTTDTYTGTVDQAAYFLDPVLLQEDNDVPIIQPNDVIICACATGGTDTFNIVGVLTSTKTAITVKLIA